MYICLFIIGNLSANEWVSFSKYALYTVTMQILLTTFANAFSVEKFVSEGKRFLIPSLFSNIICFVEKSNIAGNFVAARKFILSLSQMKIEFRCIVRATLHTHISYRLYTWNSVIWVWCKYGVWMHKCVTQFTCEIAVQIKYNWSNSLSNSIECRASNSLVALSNRRNIASRIASDLFFFFVDSIQPNAHTERTLCGFCILCCGSRW